MDDASGVFAAFDAADRMNAQRREMLALLADLVRAVHTLDRICAAKPTGEAEMVRMQLEEALKRARVEEIACLGRPFDPRWHEAAGTRCDARATCGTVLEVLTRGFRWEGEPVVLPRVIVAKGGEEDVTLSNEGAPA